MLSGYQGAMTDWYAGHHESSDSPIIWTLKISTSGEANNFNGSRGSMKLLLNLSLSDLSIGG